MARDSEVDILEAVLLTLIQLDSPQAQRRVLAYAWDFFVEHPHGEGCPQHAERKKGK